jgi:hypothetical protein
MEKRLTLTEDKGTQVKVVFVDQTEFGHKACELGACDTDCSLHTSFELANLRLDTIGNERGVRADGLESARNDPLGEFAPSNCKLPERLGPFRVVVVLVTHNLVHASTIHRAGKATYSLDPVAKQLWTGRRHFQIARETIDIAVEGEVHSEAKFAHDESFYIA